MDAASDRQELLSLTTEIVASFAGNNAVAMTDLPALIASVFAALRSAGEAQVESAPEALVPAVSIKKSVTPDFIICLEDGKKLKTLKRHLATRYNLTPAEYRQRWGLAKDYPMVAPAYAARRSEMAKQLGLGRKAGAGAAASQVGTDSSEAEPAARWRTQEGRLTTRYISARRCEEVARGLVGRPFSRVAVGPRFDCTSAEDAGRSPMPRLGAC